jgi:hypothetical protein
MRRTTAVNKPNIHKMKQHNKMKKNKQKIIENYYGGIKMSINIDVNAVAKNELYWKKEEISDMAFEAENKFFKAKTVNTKTKWRQILMDILDIQRNFERRLTEEFGYEY